MKLKQQRMNERLKDIEERVAKVEQSRHNRNKEDRISTEMRKSRSPSLDGGSQGKQQALTSRSGKNNNMNLSAENWKSDSLKGFTTVERKTQDKKASSTFRADKVKKEREKKFVFKDKLWNIKMHHIDDNVKQREKERLLKIQNYSEAHDLKQKRIEINNENRRKKFEMQRDKYIAKMKAEQEQNNEYK